MEDKRRKIVYMLISVLLAAAIWFYVDSTDGYAVSVSVQDIPVEFVGENTTLADRGLMLLSNSDHTVDLELSGTKTALMKLDPEEIHILADLESVTQPGVQNVSYRVRYPSGFDSSSISARAKKPTTSYTLSVDVGELYRESVEIRCEIVGAVANGFIAGEVQYQPSQLELRGTESEVKKVSYAKVELVLNDARETVSQALAYQLYDQYNNPVESPDIHPVTDTIQVTLPVYVTKRLPLKVNFVESPGSNLNNVEYQLDPESIMVSGDAATLLHIDSIVLDEFDLASLDSVSTHYYQIPIPAGCENLSSTSRAVMTISFKDLEVKAITTSQIVCENCPEGKVAVPLTESVPVTLRGTSTDLAALQPEDIVLHVDLQDISSASGSYTVSAQVQLPDGADIGVIGEYQVKVNIGDPEELEGSEEPVPSESTENNG